MSRSAKVILGIVTLPAPLLFLAMVFGGYWHVSGSIAAGVRVQPWLGVVMGSCIVLWGGLLLFYRLHCRKMNWLSVEQRQYWQSVLFHFNIFAIPFYWYRVIWQQES